MDDHGIRFSTWTSNDNPNPSEPSIPINYRQFRTGTSAGIGDGEDGPENLLASSWVINKYIVLQ